MQKNLITVIRSSLAAAQAALDVLEQPEAAVITGYAAAPKVEFPAPVFAEQSVQSVQSMRAEVYKSSFDKLMDELEDTRYSLRSVSELCSKTGFTSQDAIEVALNENEVDYVTRTRRRDGAALIGLADRN